MSELDLTRREVLRMLASGIAVAIAWSPLEGGAQPRVSYPEDINAYLVIGADGIVTVFSGKIEMGQGVLTSQAQMAAEELGVELSSIRMVLGDTDRCPWDMGTFGSLTTRMFGPALRAAAAKARESLLDLAARRFGVEASALGIERGNVFVRAQPQRRASYAELAGNARIAQVVGKSEILRAASDFSVMGRSPSRLDGREKVTGAARYTADMRAAGMLYARIVRPPVHGAKLASLDASGVTAIAGARWVDEGGIKAVLHERPHFADAAFAAIKATWERPTANVDGETIFERLTAAPGAPRVIAQRGDVAKARPAAGATFSSVYRKGYAAHAAMETHAALARIDGRQATVWASTQTPFPTRDRVAQAIGFDAKDVRVIVPYVGGGFGGKSADAQAVEAARLAKIAGRPVMVERTREEEFFLDTFDPAAVVQIDCGLDAQGRIAFWEERVFGSGERGASVFYDVPNLRVSVAAGSSAHPFAVGPWRAPGANMNVFAIESQLDTLAAAARVDPVEFRMRHLSDERMRRVLRTAAEAFGWTAGAGPSQRGFGVACSIDAGTYVATIAHVDVDRNTGRVRVRRMVCAQDMGIVVNPEGAKMQMEGGLTMGLGYALSEEVRFNGGDVLDRNFDTYRIPRFSDVPETIDAVLVRNDAVAPQGGGEPAITTAGASLANAVFDATGVRMMRLPMTPERVLQSLGRRGATTAAAG